MPEATAGYREFRIVPEQTTASYAVQEIFLRQNLPFRAIGVTQEIEGSFRFTTDGQPTGEVTEITVNLASLTSDDPRRDNRIRNEWLESARFPIARFVSTGATGLPEQYTDGEQVQFDLVGDLTIRDVTRPVTFAVTGVLAGDTVTGTAVGTVAMSDFGFEPPSIGGFVEVEDTVEVTLEFTAVES
ncbi:MAG: YceI family protein [Chloroflexi bacterium]|nr:YceI family protein [Chloroflexota bacterium]